MTLRERILNQCFDVSEGAIEPNNHLDIRRIREDIKLRQEVIEQLSLGIVKQYSPEFIISAPNEGPWLADAIAVRHGLDSVHLTARKDNANSEERIAFEGGIDEVMCKYLIRGVMVASVLNRFEVVNKALAVQEVGSKVIAAAAVWDRGNSATRKPLLIPVTTLVEEYIPDIVTPDSPLWQYAKNDYGGAI
jgi:hypothetical protein